MFNNIKSIFVLVNLMIIGILIVISVFTYELNEKKNSIIHAEYKRYEVVKKMNVINHKLNDISHFSRAYIVTDDALYKKKYFKLLSTLNGLLSSSDISGKYKQIEQSLSALVKFNVEAFRLNLSKPTLARALLYSPEYTTANNSVRLSFDNMLNAFEKRVTKRTQEIDYQVNLLFEKIFIAIALLGLLITIAIATIYKRIFSKINKLIKSIITFENGATSIKKFEHYNDEIGQLIDQVFIMMHSVDNNINKMNRHNMLINSILNGTDDFIFYKDQNFMYLGCNDAFLKFVGKTKNEMIGHDDFELFDEDMATLFREMDIKMLEGNKIRSNYEWITYPNGDKCYMFVQKIPFHYSEGEIGILGVVRNVTQLHLAQEQIKAKSYIDELTKLHNRKAYNERLSELLSQFERNGTKFSFMMFDVDDFKQINDTYGHRSGDEVLIKISTLVQSEIRKSDYAFRVGGEEFIVLFAETELKMAKIVAEKIRQNIEQFEFIYEKSITISIGLTEIKKEDDENIIFKRADAFLYEVKRNGKNAVRSEAIS